MATDRSARRKDPIHAVARAFGMDAATWERHANPWSVWTRVPILPLLCLAVWSRVWIGWWCLLPVAALAAWTWLNPRAFPPPRHTHAWASRAVLGERLWLARHEVAIPAHHARRAALLSGAAALGMPAILWGLWALEPWPLAVGLLLGMGAKLRFLDRMVRLHDDMTARDAVGAAARPERA